MTDRELMQQALEALEPYAILYGHIQQVVTALRERLAQPEPAPGYCKHCQQYTIEEPLPAQPETVMAEYKFQTYAAYKTDGEMKIGVVPTTRRATREEKIVRPGVYEVPVEQEPVAGEYATCLEDGERVLIASVLPVGYGGNKTRTVRVVWPDGMDGVYTMFQFARLFSPVGELTTPPRREWVGLTPEEAKEISLANRPYVVDMIAALEARLKEKNT